MLQVANLVQYIQANPPNSMYEYDHHKRLSSLGNIRDGCLWLSSIGLPEENWLFNPTDPPSIPYGQRYVGTRTICQPKGFDTVSVALASKMFQ